MALLDRVDYGDAFAADCPPDVLARHTPEELGELAMGRAPRWLRACIRITQRRMLGLQLVRSRLPVSLGWHLLSSDTQEAVYGVRGRLITPRLLVMKEPHEVVVVFLMRQERPWATPVVAVVKPIHRAIVRHLLDRCVRLAADDTGAASRGTPVPASRPGRQRRTARTSRSNRTTPRKRPAASVHSSGW